MKPSLSGSFLRNEDPMSATYNYQALYIHIPFCANRCNYCDFQTTAIAEDDPLLDSYASSLVAEIGSAAQQGLFATVETIYIGGGTPTFLGRKRLVAIVNALSECVPLSSATEFTIEANPESLDYAALRELVALGVNRLSLGIQSFDDRELVLLGRIHNAQKALAAIRAARDVLENVSIDLICGIPGQTTKSWQESLRQAVDCDVRHISVYPLTIEEHTPFARSIEAGEMGALDDDREAQLMEEAACYLENHGFKRYEVASYAKEGFACRHNCAYWTGLPYLGLGEGAASMREDARGRARLMNGKLVEMLTPEEALREDIMLGMRMSRGIPFSLLEKAIRSNPGMADTFAELQALGLIVSDNGYYRPTPHGWLMGNELYGRIWLSSPPAPSAALPERV